MFCACIVFGKDSSMEPSKSATEMPSHGRASDIRFIVEVAVYHARLLHWIQKIHENESETKHERKKASKKPMCLPNGGPECVHLLKFQYEFYVRAMMLSLR